MTKGTPTEELFAIGASRHQWDWHKGNELAVQAAREAGVSYYDPKIKLMMALIVLKLLNHFKPQNKPMIGLVREEPIELLSTDALRMRLLVLLKRRMEQL